MVAFVVNSLQSKDGGKFEISCSEYEIPSECGCEFDSDFSTNTELDSIIINPKNNKVQKLNFLEVSSIHMFPINIIDVFPNVEIVMCEMVKIKKLTYPNFRGLFRIKELFMTTGILSSIDKDSFKDLTRIELLDFNYNKIKILHQNIFVDLKELKFLHLHINEIHCLHPNLFQTNKKLLTINLSNNRISQIDSKLLIGLSDLTLFDIANNPLNIIDLKMFEGKRNLTKLNFSNNQMKAIQNLELLDQIVNYYEDANFEKGKCEEKSKNCTLKTENCNFNDSKATLKSTSILSIFMYTILSFGLAFCCSACAMYFLLSQKKTLNEDFPSYEMDAHLLTVEHEFT